MEQILWVLSGGLVPFFLLAGGVFFFLYLGGRPLLCPRGMKRALTGKEHTGGVSPFRALTLALAGTLGVGNMVGVANAICIGGAGSVFWMWVSALVAMMLKYAETVLAVRYRQKDRQGHYHGGAVYYIRNGLATRCHPKLGQVLAVCFAGLILLDACSMGCIIQINAVSSAMQGVLHFPAWVCAALLALVCLPVLPRGQHGVSALTEYLVPIMSGGYILLSLAVLILRREALTPAVCSIFREAFRPRSAVGGVVGFLTSSALRTGVMRGLLSNEAGCGTSPTAHASAQTKSPAAQGVWGILEVFVDTILLCTATALVILVAVPDPALFGDNAVMLTVHAYTSVLGDFAGWFFCAAIFCFGYATVICWYGYGAECIRFLSQKTIWARSYFVLFVLLVPLGAILAPGAVWFASDFAIACLTMLNTVVLFCLRREVKEETDRFFKAVSTKVRPPHRSRSACREKAAERIDRSTV